MPEDGKRSKKMSEAMLRGIKKGGMVINYLKKAEEKKQKKDSKEKR